MGFFFPINQLISFVFKSICFLFLAKCYFQFNLQSTRSPRNFTTFVWGMIVRLMLTAGQWPFRRVNVMCDDLDSLTLIFHFFSHFWMICKCSWRLSEAIVGFSWVANISVSSANVPNIVSLDVGKSEYIVHREEAQECSLGVHRNGCGNGLKFLHLIWFRIGVHLGTISAVVTLLRS